MKRARAGGGGGGGRQAVSTTQESESPFDDPAPANARPVAADLRQHTTRSRVSRPPCRRSRVLARCAPKRECVRGGGWARPRAPETHARERGDTPRPPSRSARAARPLPRAALGAGASAPRRRVAGGCAARARGMGRWLPREVRNPPAPPASPLLPRTQPHQPGSRGGSAGWLRARRCGAAAAVAAGVPRRVRAVLRHMRVSGSRARPPGPGDHAAAAALWRGSGDLASLLALAHAMRPLPPHSPILDLGLSHPLAPRPPPPPLPRSPKNKNLPPQTPKNNPKTQDVFR